MARDFALMRRAGINAIQTYHVPSTSVLDEAHAHGLSIIVSVPWIEQVGIAGFLDSAATRAAIRAEVANAAAACRRHPALLMYSVGVEIPAQVVRWHGKRKTETFLGDLYRVVKDQDPDGLVTYTNFPTTEYLDVPFFDVVSFNVYLHERQKLCRYLSRLQHLAGERPLVLSEFGMCSFRHGNDAQADFLRWHLEEVRDHGLAGAVWFNWTDTFFANGYHVTDWGFGLVDRDSRTKPSYHAIGEFGDQAIQTARGRRFPRTSVIVAARNAAATIDDCLASLRQLRYPDYEVIVVDDGSTDDTPSIAARYPVRLVTIPQSGLSAARNKGFREATGEIIAYIDADARADPDWLAYLAALYAESDISAAGGPNPVPPEDGWLAQCVYRAPGGPTHVMLDDRAAEHIPGCNMSFRRQTLESVGGFDPVFTAAGDDVDICWRLLEQGHRIGFHPSALVWHHRRPSVRAYWRQQVGYGRAEALLERRHPDKFDVWGRARWNGRIYGPSRRPPLFSHSSIYHGIWGSAPFQQAWEPTHQHLLASLPSAMEWHLLLLAAAGAGIVYRPAFIVVAAGIFYTCVHAAAGAATAQPKAPQHRGFRGRLEQTLRQGVLTYLHLLQPLARDWGRLTGRLTPWRGSPRSAPVARPLRRSHGLAPFRRAVETAYATNTAQQPFAILERLRAALAARGHNVTCNPGVGEWDIRISRGVLGEAYVRLLVERRPGPKHIVRISTLSAAISGSYYLDAAGALSVMGAGASGHPVVASIVGAMLAGWWLARSIEANRLDASVNAAAEGVVRDLKSMPASTS